MPSFARASLLFAVIAALAVMGPVTARANIGEDLTQLRARYGSAQAVGNQMLFEKDGFSICVYFDGAHSGMEILVCDGSKPNKTDFTEDDIQRWLNAESDGLIWNVIQLPNGRRTWMRSDNKVIARFTSGDKPEDKYLTFMLNAK